MQQDNNPDVLNPRDVEHENEEDVFRTEEIIIEEMAIDGICGVY